MLTFTEFSGSPYHIGLALGKLGAPAVHTNVKPTPQWEHLMQWRGSEQLKTMQDLVQQHQPYIWDELQGLARGLELPPDDVFLWNCHGELSVYHDSTTLLMPAPQGPRISYSLSVDTAITQYCSIAEFRVDQGPEFATLTYPGLLPGHTVAVTSNGIGLAVNNISEQNWAPGIPGRVLTRALLNAPDLSSAIQLLNDSPRSCNLHLALAQRAGSALLSIELTPEEVAIQHIKTPFVHTNHLIHESLDSPDQNVAESSRRRRDQGILFLNESDIPDPVQILSRLFSHTDATETDLTKTDATEQESNTEDTSTSYAPITADLHIGADAVQWDIYEHPDEPARFRMHDARHI